MINSQVYSEPNYSMQNVLEGNIEIKMFYSLNYRNESPLVQSKIYSQAHLGHAPKWNNRSYQIGKAE